MSRSNGIEPQLPHISEIAFNIKGTNKMSMEINECIYKITSPTGRIYIGQSKNIEKRISYYSGLQCFEQHKIFASIKKHGWNNHSFDILELCNSTNIDEKEKYWISNYNSASDNHLNILTGGKGSSGRIWTREMRDRARNACLGRKMSSEVIEKRRAKMIGQKRTEETRQKMRDTWKRKRLENPKVEKLKIKLKSGRKKGTKMTIEQIEKMSKRMLEFHHFKGKKHKPESLLKMSIARKGKKLSEDIRARMNKAPFSEERKEKTRQRMLTNNPFKGKKHSEETKLKMRETKAKNKLQNNNSQV
jgi:group I intron endonuclease